MRLSCWPAEHVPGIGTRPSTPFTPSASCLPCLPAAGIQLAQFFVYRLDRLPYLLVGVRGRDKEPQTGGFFFDCRVKDWVDIDTARQVLGYAPQDNAEEWLDN